MQPDPNGIFPGALLFIKTIIIYCVIYYAQMER